MLDLPSSTPSSSARRAGVALADDVAVEELADLVWLGQFLQQPDLAALGEFLFDDLVAKINALVADVDTRTSDELLDLLLALSAERTLQQVAALSDARHTASFSSPSAPLAHSP
jgi:hypothetical protein